jgi:hypothetical protein
LCHPIAASLASTFEVHSDYCLDFACCICSGAEVQALGESVGMKLVRVKKGEAVAVYADINFAVYKTGR